MQYRLLSEYIAKCINKCTEGSQYLVAMVFIQMRIHEIANVTDK